ncbi:uncharacterized protein LOC118405029 [Branchiostoma floridae]|uniref:Uncharacterized protein LOC118405029 n=1 Tax=Branchiostoma floridae TaxID=7739 RepID=A0A9J7KIL7_BRAFL|nr:uncharacterized protein LOC118405029 [Branchiostoma floridae]
MQIYFGKTANVTGVVISGGGFARMMDSWVTSFTLAFSMDGVAWTPYGDSGGDVQVFQGNRDPYNQVSRPLDHPVTSRYIRLYPTGYRGWGALRMEVYVTNDEDTWLQRGEYSSLVVDPDPLHPRMFKRVPDYSASSRVDAFYPHQARLNNGRGQQQGACWSPGNHTRGEHWLQITHGVLYRVAGVITQGAYNMDAWVTSYRLEFSMDGQIWTTYKNSDGEAKVFQGNTDNYRYARNILDNPVFALYTRFIPITFHNQIALRAEVLVMQGCAAQEVFCDGRCQAKGRLCLVLGRCVPRQFQYEDKPICEEILQATCGTESTLKFDELECSVNQILNVIFYPSLQKSTTSSTNVNMPLRTSNSIVRVQSTLDPDPNRVSPAAWPGLPGGFESAPGLSGGFESAPGLSGGFESAPGLSGGFESAPGLSGGFESAPGLPDGFESAPGLSGGLESASGLSGGFESAPGLSGGFESAPGLPDGFESAPGLSGGFESAPGLSGGFESAPGLSGGFESAPSLSGGFESEPGLSGGFESAPGLSGGFESSSGLSGGFESAPGLSGGFESAPGLSGGFESAPGLSGGFESAPGLSGGFESAPGLSGGFESAPGLSGGFESAPGLSGDIESAPGLSGGFESAPGLSGGFESAPGLSGDIESAPGLSGGFESAPGLSGGFESAPGLPGGFESAPGLSAESGISGGFLESEGTTEKYHYIQACDGIYDCSNRKDEQNCEEMECVLRCETESGDPCIPKRWICDNTADCLDGEDEQGCSNEKASIGCFFKCLSGAFIVTEICVPPHQLGDGQEDCGLGEDEDPRQVELALEAWFGTCNFNCPSVYGNASCVPDVFMCDGTADCLGEEDEKSCGVVEESCFTFSCGFPGDPTPLCVPEHLICDGHPDCLTGEDEQGCGPAAAGMVEKIGQETDEEATVNVETEEGPTVGQEAVAEPSSGRGPSDGQPGFHAGSGGAFNRASFWMTAAAMGLQIFYR